MTFLKCDLTSDDRVTPHLKPKGEAVDFISFKLLKSTFGRKAKSKQDDGAAFSLAQKAIISAQNVLWLELKLI